MSSHRPLRRLAALVAAGLVISTAGIAHADNVVIDGDMITAGTQGSVAFGSVPCGSATTKSVTISVTRNGNYPNNNVYADGAVVSFTASGTNPIVTVSIPTASAGTVSLPSAWQSTPISQPAADTVTAAVTIQPTVAGSVSESITVLGTGTGSNSVPGGTISRNVTVPVTATVGSCSAPTPTTTTVTCPTSTTYTGAALTPCTATTTANGGSSQTTAVSYANNTSAGSGTATASFAGDATHSPSIGSATFTIDKATSTTTVSCAPTSLTYTGSPVTPSCTATATGAGGLSVGVTPVTFTGNTDAGTARASAAYGGDANHLSSTGSTTFAITPSGATCTVTGYSGLYDGSPHGASGSCTGVGGAAVPGLSVTGSLTDVPGGTVGWTFSNPNYAPESGSAAVTITRAPSAVTVSCPPSAVYTGGAITPCTATVTGAGSLSQSVTDLTYANNTSTGAATVTAAYGGDTNHTGSTGSGGFAVSKAPSSTKVSCPASVVFTGTSHEPCTAKVTGAGGLSHDVTGSISYAANTAVGTASASATWSGDDDHLGSGDSATFAIGVAPSVVSLSCVGPVTYDTTAQQPCSATVSGAGLTDFTVPVHYMDNVDAGDNTAHASAAWDGDANHSGNSAATTFSIDKAGSTTTLTCLTSVTYDGTAQQPCTAQATGVGLDPIPVTPTYTGNTNAGTATASAHYAGDGNHQASDATATTFTVDPATPTCTITGHSDTYDARPHGATGTCTGVGGPTELLPGLGLGGTYTDVPGGTAHWTIPASANYTTASGDATISIDKATADCEVLGYAGTYDGGPHGATGTCTGVGAAPDILPGLDLGASFIVVAGGSAAWSLAGGTNYTDQAGSVQIAIGPATSTVAVTCPASVSYTGDPQTPCAAQATGAGGLDVAVGGLTYLHNTDAGTATANASYSGDANHHASTGSKDFEITRAPSNVVISCIGPSTYTGTAQTPCTATALGAGGLSVDVTDSLVYANNSAAGTAGVSAAYGGDANHTPSDASTTFTIGKADSTTAVTCTDPLTFTGSPLTPCTALATGAGLLNVSVSPLHYTANTDAGTATADAAYGGDANHRASSGSATFVIRPASSTTSVVCPATVVYTGSELRPCTATVTGAGGLDQPVTPVTHSDNTVVGTASASATYAGDANHAGSSGSATFQIAKASTHIAISCTGPVTYTGAAQSPCVATASGAGLTDFAVPVSYGNNTDAGTATANAAYGGDANHDGTVAGTTFTIGKAASATTVTCPASVIFTRSALTPCSAAVTGVGGLGQAVTPVTYLNNTAVGTAIASAVFAGDANHLGSSGNATFKIGAWTLKGFYQPVDMGGVVNMVKGGSTVPLKFNAYAGSTEITDLTTLGATFKVVSMTCATNVITSDDLSTTTGGTTLRYDTTGGQWIQNWQTPKSPGLCYLASLTTADGSALVAVFKTK